tara:strand:- start:340 stop:675 length:336 start_codon:yes stop_codon:yes gene_type:complete
MAYTKINFNNTINSSLQVGDMAYYANVLSGGIIDEPIQAGKVLNINPTYIIIDRDFNEGGITAGQFLLFSKRVEVNDSSLKGYYADITLKNDSKKPIELFAVASEVGISSK